MNELEHNSATPKVNTIYWVIAGLGFLWNLMGVYQFYVEYNFWSKPDTRSALPPEFGPLYDASPSWLYVVFAIAVLAGLLGCVGLLLRKKWAVPVFMVSLIAVFIQMGYNLFGMDTLNVLGKSAAIMPLVVVGFALLLYLFSKRSLHRGYLS